MTDKTIRAAEATQLLNNKLLIESFNNIRESVVHKLESKYCNEEERLAANIALNLLRQIRANMEKYINDGKVEEFNLRQRKNWLG